MNLKISEYHITKEIEFFGHLEPFKTSGLPTDSIIFKTLPGFGATFWEINYPYRNSIIFEPHVPVIIGKSGKHPTMLGVYKKTKRADIKAYLDSEIYPKKIMTTPESYVMKVKPVIEEHKEFNLYTDFFALFDECDRLITDANYRAQILAPVDDLFLFKQKALVSATAIEPSDPRFAEHGFQIVKIVPDYDYKKDLNLIITNNIVLMVRMQLAKYKTKKPIFIFLNSTLTIFTIIKLLEIKDESKIFCGEESVAVLDELGITNLSTELGDYKKYNFLTSRFFSAVDIDLDYKPDVLIITDVFAANHSILDPSTDVIQISGRFRKQNKNDNVTVNSLTHIANIKGDIKYKEPEDAEKYIKSSYGAYSHMREQMDKATDEGARTTFTQGLANTEIKDFVGNDGKLLWFMYDNYLRQQKIRKYYTNALLLNQAYQDCLYFDVHYKLDLKSISDADNSMLAMAKTKIAVTEAVANLLVKHEATKDAEFTLYDPKIEVVNLRLKYEDVVKAFETIGYERMKSLGFKMNLINIAVNKSILKSKQFSKEMFDAVHKEFENDESVTHRSSVKRLQRVYEANGLNLVARGSHLAFYFEGRRSTDVSKKHNFILESKKTPTQADSDIQNIIPN